MGEVLSILFPRLAQCVVGKVKSTGNYSSILYILKRRQIADTNIAQQRGPAKKTDKGRLRFMDMGKSSASL